MQALLQPDGRLHCTLEVCKRSKTEITASHTWRPLLLNQQTLHQRLREIGREKDRPHYSGPGPSPGILRALTGMRFPWLGASEGERRRFKPARAAGMF